MSCGSPGNIRSRRRRASFEPPPRCGPATAFWSATGMSLPRRRRVGEAASAKAPAYNLLVLQPGPTWPTASWSTTRAAFCPRRSSARQTAQKCPYPASAPRSAAGVYDRGPAGLREGQERSGPRGGRIQDLKTRNITVHVTAEHPFYVGNGTLRPWKVEARRRIFAFDGEGLSRQPIESITAVHEKGHHLQSAHGHAQYVPGQRFSGSQQGWWRARGRRVPRRRRIPQRRILRRIKLIQHLQTGSASVLAWARASQWSSSPSARSQASSWVCAA